MGAILGFLKRLFEHKEKIILGALIVAFIGVGYSQWKEKGNEEGPNKNGEESDIPKPANPKLDPAPTYEMPSLGNSLAVDNQLALTDDKIFVKPAVDKEKPDSDQPTEWPTIVIRSIFDPTKSGAFIAIIEINGKREFMKEGGIFHKFYSVRRIDGVRNCITIVKRGSKSGEEEEREFCKDS